MLRLSAPLPESSSLTPRTAFHKLLQRIGSFSLSPKQLISIRYFQQPRTWILLSILSMHFVIIAFYSLQPSSSATTRPELNSMDGHLIAPASMEDHCWDGKVFVYHLPEILNIGVIQNCDELNPWSSTCDAFANNGFGQSDNRIIEIVPENLAPAWYATDQFTSEIIFHNRILKHKCRTTDPSKATAFYIPFYAGLAVGRFLWANYSSEDRDRHCKLMLRWVQDQMHYRKSNGWDHFITMGRITWDFRRSKDNDWGSSCIYLPGMRNITRLLIERNPWDYFDVGVPYPTGFHPQSVTDVLEWQEFVRSRNRSKLFCFVGSTRSRIKNDFRGVLLRQCYDSGSCRVVDCGRNKCSNGTMEILKSFLDSNFCLQPRGDSFTRRSIFDCLIAGSIPVFFWKRTAYYQYKWFLPGEADSYSVFIDRNQVKNGDSIKKVLERFGEEEVRKMRDKVIEFIPKLVYASPQEGLRGIKDAFDTALDGVLSRFREQEQWSFKWK